MLKKTIIITGASSGIGKALAKHLASLNHHIIAVARREKHLISLHEMYPANIKIVVADVTKEDDRVKIKEALNPQEKGVFLIHNAGLATPRLLPEISEDEWDQHYKTHVNGPVFLTKLLLPHLQNGGRILNISSGLAHTPCIGMTAYGVSKAALYMLKEYCNVELQTLGIMFGSAMPGVIDTPIQEKLRECSPKQFPAANTYKAFFDHGELLSPETAAKFLSWLLLNVDDKKYITGDWSIYDTSHHPFWAQPHEVVQRRKTNEELKKE